MYEADDANIQYTGRIDFTNPKQPKFALGATYVTARFKGTGVSVLLKDEHRYGKWRNYYDAIVDGMVVQKIQPRRRRHDASSTRSRPTSPTASTSVTIVKRTEPNVGIGYFVGFEIAGEILPPPGAPGAQAAVLRRFDHRRLRHRGAGRRSGLQRRRVGPAGRERRPARTAPSPRACWTPTTTCWACPASASSGTTTAIRRRATRARCRRSRTCTLPEPIRAEPAIWTRRELPAGRDRRRAGDERLLAGPLNPDNTPADGRAIMDVATFATAYIAVRR